MTTAEQAEAVINRDEIAWQIQLAVRHADKTIYMPTPTATN